MNKYLISFPNCILVKGKNRSLIQDLQRREIHFIPNDLYDFLIFSNKKSMTSILSQYAKHKSIVEEYIQFLLEKEYAFIGSYNDTLLMDSLDDTYHFPGEISNSIIELSAKNMKCLDSIFAKLNELKCNSVQFISYIDSFNKYKLHEILNRLEGLSYLINIQFLIKYMEGIDFEQIVLFCQRNLRIGEFIVHSSPFEKEKVFRNGGVVKFAKQKISNRRFCGVVKTDNFSLNENQLFESKSYNSCLNGKISIDVNGNIKNCPSMPQSFGNIENTSLREALEHEDFKKYWSITKDEIDVCKNCEFRFVCTDCRAYLEEPNNKYSKPLKCGYSPQTNKWEEWSTNPLKKKAIEYYGMQELVAKND